MPCSLGLQTASSAYHAGGVGGQFLEMIPAGAPPPMVVTKQLTTVIDDQRTAQIVVVAKTPAAPEGLEMGHFQLGGIHPQRAGSQRVQVTFHLVSENKLQCTAFYKQGNRKRHLTFVDKASLRHVVL